MQLVLLRYGDNWLHKSWRYIYIHLKISNKLSINVKLIYNFSTIFQNNDICGIKGYITTPLIVDGRNTLKNAYPWLVAMYYKNSFNCGGNLISNEYILTGAALNTSLLNTHYKINNFFLLSSCPLYNWASFR